MSSSADPLRVAPAIAASVRFADERLHVLLTDGREISVPVDQFPRLRDATLVQRNHWEIASFGTAVRWPELDEDIGVAGLLGVSETALEEAAGYTIHNRERSR